MNKTRTIALLWGFLLAFFLVAGSMDNAVLFIWVLVNGLLTWRIVEKS